MHLKNLNSNLTEAFTDVKQHLAMWTAQFRCWVGCATTRVLNSVSDAAQFQAFANKLKTREVFDLLGVLPTKDRGPGHHDSLKMRNDPDI